MRLVEAHKGILYKICRLYQDRDEERQDLLQEIQGLCLLCDAGYVFVMDRVDGCRWADGVFAVVPLRGWRGGYGCGMGIICSN